jgi:hypothetical protein
MGGKNGFTLLVCPAIALNSTRSAFSQLDSATVCFYTFTFGGHGFFH